MITRRTRIQLAIFLAITLIGVSFVGAKYARLNQLFYKSGYTVVAHFADSGGIYQGGEVSYRGVKIGQVGKLTLTHSGVDVDLDIGTKWDKIPAKTLAVVGNRSAVGEQYVELQPQDDSQPYLHDGSQIAQPDTRTPLPTQKLLADTATTVSSVDKQSLTTVIHELGQAFGGTGQDLQTILDTSTDFINTADQNFDLTTSLLNDGNTVLKGQVDSEGAIRGFANDLSLFSQTLAGHDQDLRLLIKNGDLGANALKTFLDENGVNLGELLAESVTTGQIIYQHLDGFKLVLVAYPYVVEGGFTVDDLDPSDGQYYAHFGLVITNKEPCHQGYEGTHQRPPAQLQTQPMNTAAHCAEPASKSNARGAQNLNRAPVAFYDSSTKKLTWAGQTSSGSAGTVAASPSGSAGKDAWSWMYGQ